MKKTFFIFLFSCFVLFSYAQKWKLTRYEAIIGIGTANYFGDIGGSATPGNWLGIKDISPLSTRPGITVAARYKLTQEMAIKLAISTIMLSGNDAGSINESRGFKFSSYGLEHSLHYEYSLISEDKRQRSFAYYNRRGMLNNFSRKNVYVFAGIGGMVYYPSFTGNLSKFDQASKSLSYSMVFPVGLGVKMILNNYYSVGVEFGGRYCLTDNIDGLTTSFSKFNDIYYFGNISLIYRIKTSRTGYPILFRNY